MKKSIKITISSLVLLFVVIHAQAQEAAATAPVAEVKRVNQDKNQPAVREAIIPEIKNPAGPAAPALQKSEAPPAAAIAAPLYPAAEVLKSADMRASTHKKIDLKAYPKPQLTAPASEDPRVLNPLPVKETVPAIIDRPRS